MLLQRTIAERAQCSGVGLHTGQSIRLEVFPAAVNEGLTFVRTDLPMHGELRPSVDQVVGTTLATTLGTGVNGSRASVNTVEHLLAALFGLGIDNARIHLDGPEVPIIDGSARPFVDMLTTAGIVEQKRTKRFLVIRRKLEVTDGNKLARLSPAEGLTINCGIDFDHPLISTTAFEFSFTEDSFVREIAGARTFGFLREVESLRDRGLALGGSLDNAIVIDRHSVLNPDGLRYPDEFVRHKALDAVGDLALFGMPVIGRLHLRRSGHALNIRLVQEVLADARNYEIVEPAGRGTEDRAAFAVFESLGAT